MRATHGACLPAGVALAAVLSLAGCAPDYGYGTYGYGYGPEYPAYAYPEYGYGYPYSPGFVGIFGGGSLFHPDHGVEHHEYPAHEFEHHEHPPHEFEHHGFAGNFGHPAFSAQHSTAPPPTLHAAGPAPASAVHAPHFGGHAPTAQFPHAG
ncbi:MAG: hypothetical protein JO122_16685 [Acetobacteraceae bacterium]|nr:hypothetical protein [Acetobacteraceae bacterium]